MKRLLLIVLVLIGMTSWTMAQDHHQAAAHHPNHKPVHHHRHPVHHHPAHHPVHHADHR